MAKSRARTATGQFKKGGGSHKKSRARKPIVVAAQRAPARRAPTVIVAGGTKSPAKHKRRHGLVRGGHGVGAFIPNITRKGPDLIASAAYGWVTTRDAGTPGAQLNDLLKKVPTVAAIGAPATHGLLFNLIAVMTKGTVRMIADRGATAALHRAMYALGASGFDFTKWAAMSGEAESDLAGELSGSIDIEEAAGMGEDLEELR